MAATPSNMMALGTPAPSFSLPNTLDDELVDFNMVKGEKGTLVAFICNHCPYVLHMVERFSEMSNSLMAKGMGVVAISSNDVENYPQDGPDHMRAFGKSHGFGFPYLYDESQEVARAYLAACTPDLFLFDQNDLCYYRGQFDPSRPGNGFEVNGEDLDRAVNDLLNGFPHPEPQIPSIGCNIKWKA